MERLRFLYRFKLGRRLLLWWQSRRIGNRLQNWKSHKPCGLCRGWED